MSVVSEWRGSVSVVEESLIGSVVCVFALVYILTRWVLRPSPAHVWLCRDG